VDDLLGGTVPARRALTVRALVTFILGFGLLFDNTLPIQRAIDERQLVNGPPVPMTPHPPDEWMRRFGTLPLMHQPGERWMYNTGSLLQGVLIRRASGYSFEAFVRERITTPLGMRDMDFFVPLRRSSAGSPDAESSPTPKVERRAAWIATAPPARTHADRFSPRAPVVLCRRSTTTSRSRACCSTAACTRAGGCSAPSP